MLNLTNIGRFGTDEYRKPHHTSFIMVEFRKIYIRIRLDFAKVPDVFEISTRNLDMIQKLLTSMHCHQTELPFSGGLSTFGMYRRHTLILSIQSDEHPSKPTRTNDEEYKHKRYSASRDPFGGILSRHGDTWRPGAACRLAGMSSLVYPRAQRVPALDMHLI